MIFATLVLVTILPLGILIYAILTPDFTNREQILIGTSVGVISGAGLSLYVWCNISSMRS